MVAMNVLNSDLLYTTTLFISLLLLTSSVSCADQQPISVAHNVSVLMAEKTRLGSTPPSCRNKCDDCNPCIAVQVPTVPIQNGFRPISGRKIPTELVDESSSSTSAKNYSDYKPLGWKCRCRGRLFNP